MPLKKASEEKHDQVNLPFTDLSRFQLRSSHNLIRYDNEHEVGVEAMYGFQPGIMLRVLDLTHLSDSICQLSVPEKKLMFCFKLVGDSVIEVEGGDSYSMYEGSLLVAYTEHQKLLRETASKDQKYVLVMLISDPDVLLLPPFDQAANELPSIIQDALMGETFRVESFTMDRDLILALRILLNSDTTDMFNRPFIQAKSVEIMCLALRAMLTQESQRERANISVKEQETMEKAGQLLQMRWQNPPNQEELVKLLGIGRSRLTNCFKIVHGCSITDYLLNIRMQHAQQLLREGKLNVTQVAMEAGYEHPGNFTSVFKRQFGITPKKFQKESYLRHIASK